MSLKRIATATVGVTAAQIVFSDIPQTYTDLWLVVSVRSGNGGNGDFTLNFNTNGSPTNSFRNFQAGAGATSTTQNAFSATTIIGSVPQASNSSVFSNTSIKIVDYALTTDKIVFVQDGTNYNATSNGGLASAAFRVVATASPITSITLSDAAVTNFTQNSTATLYGILKGNGGATVTTT
jgi:hypothetical protein